LERGFKTALPLLGGLAGWQDRGYSVVPVSAEPLADRAGGSLVRSVLPPPPALHSHQ
jgi:hypothetical protein